MEKYTSIKDSISDMSGGDINPHYRKRIIPIIFIIIGIPLIIWGIVKWNDIGYEQISYVLVFCSLFLIGWGIVKLSYNTEYYLCDSTGEVINPETYYLDPDKKDVIEELLNDDKLRDVLDYSIKRHSPLMLELWNVNSQKLIYAQLIRNNGKFKEPVSKVHVSQTK